MSTTAPSTWLGGAVTALPYAFLPQYFGFPYLKTPVPPPAPPCGMPMVMGMPAPWPGAPMVPPSMPTMPAVATVPCVQPLSPQSTTGAGEFSPGGPSSDDTRSVPSAGSPKSSDIEDAAALVSLADDMESRRAAQNRAEKERRNILKSGFEELKMMVPECGKNYSKAKILHKAVDYVSDLVREKTSLLQEAEKLRAEVQHLRGILRQYEEMDGVPPAEVAANLEARTRSIDSVDIKFYVFCCVVEKLYETFCATVSLENAEVFSSSLLQWFKGHCTAETFLRPLQAIGSRLFTPESATLRRCKSTLTAGKDVVVMMLDEGGRRGVPFSKKLGATIDYVGTLCLEEPASA